MGDLRINLRLEGNAEETAMFEQCKVELGFTEDGQGFLTAECPDCGEQVKRFMLDIVPGASVSCTCGTFNVGFEGDGLRNLQGSLDAAWKALKNNLSN